MIRKYILHILLFSIAFALYANTISNNYCLDDEFVTNHNPQIAKGISAIPEIFTSFYQQSQGFTYGYRPVVKASFAVEYSLFGWNPHVSHLINALIYAMLALLLFAVLRSLFLREHYLFALVATLLFIAHPIHTEVVASLKNRDELLSAAGAFAALLCFLRSTVRRKMLYMILGAVFLLFALLSKLSALPFIVLIPLSFFYIRKPSAGDLVDRAVLSMQTKIQVGISVLFFIASILLLFINFAAINVRSFLLATAAFALLMVHFQRKAARAGFGPKNIYFWFPGILCLVFALTFFLRGQGWWALPVMLITYCGMFFLALKANLPGNRELIRAFRKTPAYVAILFLLILIGGLYGLLSSFAPAAGGGTATPEYQLLFWQNPLYFSVNFFDHISAAGATLWFYAKQMVIPHPYGFYYGYDMVPSDWQRADVWISLVLHSGLLLASVWQFFLKRHPAAFGFLIYFISLLMYSNLFVPVAGIVAERHVFIASAGFCIMLTWTVFRLLKVRAFAKTLSVMQKILLTVIALLILIPYTWITVTRNRDWKDHTSLFSSGIDYLERSVKANDLMAASLYRDVMKDISQGKNSEHVRKQLEKVASLYRRSVNIYPQHYNAWNNIGIIHAQYLRNYGEAVTCFTEAVRVKPDFAEGFSNMGFAFFMSGDFKASVRAYETALELVPDSTDVMSSLANVYFRSGKVTKAVEMNQRIAAIDPSSDLPLLNMASYALAEGDSLKAMGYYEVVWTRNPANRELSALLHDYYMRHGNPVKAAVFINRGFSQK